LHAVDVRVGFVALHFGFDKLCLEGGLKGIDEDFQLKRILHFFVEKKRFIQEKLDFFSFFNKIPIILD
jgi:hypothetical protein